MNLFLKKNIFIETNRSNSTNVSNLYQLNKLTNKNSSTRIENVSSLNNYSKNKILSPRLCVKYNSKIFKKINNTKTNKNIFSAKKLPIKMRIWRNNKLNLSKNEFFTQKEETQIKNERIQSILSKAINWDKKQIENNEQFKDAKIYCEKEKEILNMQKSLFENNIYFFDTRYKNNKTKEIIKPSRFSEFKDNYFYIKDKTTDIKNEIRINKSINKFIDAEKAFNDFENSNLDKLKKIYEYVEVNKIKKKKYKEVIDSTYNLLSQAKKECELSVDLLRERIKALQKYYEAYIISYSKIKDLKDKRIKLYEEKIIKYREYLGIYEEIMEKIEHYENNYNLIKADLNSFIDEIQKKVDIITKEINKFRYLFNELKQQQIEYYLDKLKKGRDTRKEGLSWIIEKLMELGVHIETNLFPGFLDNEQIEYIIKISELIFELHQLGIILKTFKDKKKQFLNKQSTKNKILNTTSDRINKIKLNKITKEEDSLSYDINFEIDFNSCFNEFIKDKKLNNSKLIQLQKKFKIKEGFNASIRNKIEDNKLKIITKRIKNKMKMYAETNDSRILKEEKKDNEKNIITETEYFNDIGMVSERIENLNEIIEKLKKDEYLIFKKKIKMMKDKERNKKFVLIYNALFGNIIFDIESKYQTIFTKY